QILNNTINAWGAGNTSPWGSGYYNSHSIYINSGADVVVNRQNSISGTVIKGNTINGSRAFGVRLEGDKGAIVSNNLFENMICGTEPAYNGFGIIQAIWTGSAGAAGLTDYADIVGNTIENFSATCAVGNGSFANAGVHCDGNKLGGTIEQNFI